MLMRRLKLAMRVALGLPLQGVRIDTDFLLDKGVESEFDHTKAAPFDLSFDGVVEEPPERVIREKAFRVCVFREVKSPARWLVLELKGKRKWHHLVTLHERNLAVMLGVLGQVQSALDEEKFAGEARDLIGRAVFGRATDVYHGEVESLKTATKEAVAVDLMEGEGQYGPAEWFVRLSIGDNQERDFGIVGETDLSMDAAKMLALHLRAAFLAVERGKRKQEATR
jgi:hypothetical protein